MPEALSADRTAEWLLWYYDQPSRYRAEGRRRDAPLLNSAVVLKLALGRRVEFAEPALSEAGTLATLRNAAALYVRFLFFRQDATPYQVLGLEPSAGPEAIKESFRLLMQLVHPDRQDARVVWPDSFAALANRAYGIVRNPDERVKIDRDVEARAAMARAVNRAAAADAASMRPVPVRPLPLVRRRGALRRVLLPEWVTAGVGGFVRQHPSATAFAALITVAALWVGVIVWDKEVLLIRDIEADPEGVSATSLARLPKFAWFSMPGSAPGPVPGGGADTGVATLADAKAPSAAPKSASAADARMSLGNRGTEPPVAATGGAPAPASIATDQDASANLMPADTRVELSGPAARQAAAAESAQPPAATATGAHSGSVVTMPVVATGAPVQSPPASAAVTTAPIDPATSVVSSGAAVPPATTEIEMLFAMFVDSYERGRVDAFADLFDLDAETNSRRGRTAIRGEYDELFRLSQWRKMQLTRVNWKRVGNHAIAKGEITVKIGWRDGSEVEQRLVLDMELTRRDGRVVIARMSQQPRP